MFLSASISLYRCELENDLKMEKDISEAISTVPGAQSFLLSAYSDLRADEVTGSVYWQLFATDYSLPAPGTVMARSTFAKLSTESNDVDIFNIYKQHYKIINNTNILIGNISQIRSKPLSKTDSLAWNKIEGEARFIRGFLYFNLVRLFRNPPIVIEKINNLSSIDNIANEPADRMAVQEQKVYDLIVQDLEKSVALLGNDVVRGKTNKFAAHGVLGKVYLNMASIAKYRDKVTTVDTKSLYEKSLFHLNKVITSGSFGLKQYFPDNFIRDKQHLGANESLFTLEFNEIDAYNTRVGLNSGYVSNAGSSAEMGQVGSANGGSLANDFGISVYDLDSPGDIVRRNWTFEEGEFQKFEANGNNTYQTSVSDCPGENCEIFVKSFEPYPWARPYWYELISKDNAGWRSLAPPTATSNPQLPVQSVATVAGKTYFKNNVWSNNANTNSIINFRLVKFRRNPLTQSGYTPSRYDADLSLMRYAEVLLMYAEVANELGNGPTALPTGGSMTALQAVNMVRNRARNFTYYEALTVDSRIMSTGPYKATYKDIFSRQLNSQRRYVTLTGDAATTTASDTLKKYYNRISAFRGIRDASTTVSIRNFKDFEETKNFVPDFPESLDQGEFIKKLLEERWRELAGEQNSRWFDLTRFGLLVNNVKNNKSETNALTGRNLSATPYGTQVLNTPNAKYEYLPIPLNELRLHPKLNQNKDY